MDEAINVLLRARVVSRRIGGVLFSRDPGLNQVVVVSGSGPPLEVQVHSSGAHVREALFEPLLWAAAVNSPAQEQSDGTSTEASQGREQACLSFPGLQAFTEHSLGLSYFSKS